MKKTIKLGVIGAGSFSDSHLKGIQYAKTAEAVAVCDVIKEKAKAQAEKYGIPSYYTDYHELLKRDDIDAVTLPLPDQVHAEVTVAALRAGKHVLCEKPMALNKEDCKKMIGAARETGKELMIGQIGRYTPSFIMAQKMVKSGDIGELFFVESEYAHDYARIAGQGSWRVTPERHPIIGGGCHAIDLLRMIAGNPTEVFAYANNKVLTSWPISDCTVAIMKFPDRVIGKVLTSIGCKRKYTMRSVFYGSKGSIIVDNTSPTLTLYKSEFSQMEELKNISQQSIEIRIPVTINNHNFEFEVNDFCTRLLEGKPVTTDGVEGASTVAVGLAIVESAAKEEKVKVDYDFNEF